MDIFIMNVYNYVCIGKGIFYDDLYDIFNF